MRFEACERPERKGYTQTKNLAFINGFIKSEIPIARVFEYEHKTAYIAAKAINRSAEQFNLTHINAFVANGNLYIENRALTEQSE